MEFEIILPKKTEQNQASTAILVLDIINIFQMDPKYIWG